jgi:hypothetical protein
MVEVSLQERGGEIVRVFQIVKSNSPAFEVGFELTGDVTFSNFIEHMKRESGTDLPMEAPKPATVPETIEEKPQPLTLVQPQLTVQDLIAKATKHGFKEADIVTGAKVYHNQPNIYRLTPEQIADIDRRLTARIEKTQAQAAGGADANQTPQGAPGAKPQTPRNVRRA